MSWVSFLAIYFIVWWVVLFAMLPIGLRTQHEEDDVTLGTIPSAPGRSHMPKTVLRTTIVSALVMGAYYVLFHVFGWSFSDLPRIGPRP